MKNTPLFITAAAMLLLAPAAPAQEHAELKAQLTELEKKAGEAREAGRETELARIEQQLQELRQRAAAMAAERAEAEKKESAEKEAKARTDAAGRERKPESEPRAERGREMDRRAEPKREPERRDRPDGDRSEPDRRPGPDGLRAKLEETRAALGEAEKNGREEMARQLRQQISRLESALKENSGPRDAPERRDASDGPDRPDMERADHIRQAIRHLHAAGMHEAANHLSAQLDRPREQGGPEHPPLETQVHQLRAELQDMRRGMDRLRQRVEELSSPRKAVMPASP